MVPYTIPVQLKLAHHLAGQRRSSIADVQRASIDRWH